MSNNQETTAPTGHTVSITVYTAEELQEVNPEAFEKAHYDWITTQWDWSLTDWVNENMHTLIEELYPSLAKCSLSWSLSYSQGDGVGFNTCTLTAEQIKELGEDESENTFKIRSNGTWFKVEPEEYTEEAEATAERLTETLYRLCEELETIGYNTIEYHTSETAFTDESNENQYDINGQII